MSTLVLGLQSLVHPWGGNLPLVAFVLGIVVAGLLAPLGFWRLTTPPVGVPAMAVSSGVACMGHGPTLFVLRLNAALT